uniref:RNA-directed DNA polymerase n=1 Tax=Homalodisca liturata TaxID=320908 RepID=A0A1B6IQT6_9HEMI
MDNITADTLSRISPQHMSSDANNLTELSIHYIERIPDQHLQDQLRNLPQLQHQDPKLQTLIEILQSPMETNEFQQLYTNYRLYDNTLLQNFKGKWLIVIPESVIKPLILECHLYYLHCGAKKCFLLLRENFIFKNMHRTIRQLLSSCDKCQRCKINNHPLNSQAKGVKCREKNDQLAVDIIGPLPTSVGNTKYMLIVIDIFTKFVKLYPLQRATTRSILHKLFHHHFPNYGFPKRIQSDNGTQFKSNEWIRKFESHSIQLIYSPVYHPSFNLAERPIREIKRCLRTYCSQNHKRWVKYVPVINECLNEIYHESTGFTPNELQFGTRNIRFWEKYVSNPLAEEVPIEHKLLIARRKLEESRKKRSDKINEKRKPVSLQINDQVLVKSHHLSKAIAGETSKLFEVYEGPFIIQEILGKSTYQISDLSKEHVYGPYHISSLKPYKNSVNNAIEDTEVVASGRA